MARIKKTFIFCILFSRISLCQNLSTDENKIGYDLARSIRSIGTGGADIIAESFTALWQNGGFTQVHKQLIRDISLKMKERKYFVNPHYEYLCAYTAFAIKRAGIPSDSLTHLLEMNKFVVEHYSYKQYEDFLLLMNIFFVRGALVLKPHYKMFVRNGTYSFQNLDAENIIPPPPTTENIAEKTDSLIAKEDTWDNKIVENKSEEISSFFGFQTGSEITRGRQKIVFQNVDIIIVSYNDSVNIKNTSGSFLIAEKIWEGKGGEFQWSSKNNFFNDAQISLSSYEFSVLKPEIFCKNVTLTFNSLLDKTTEGDFEYKGILGTAKEKQIYPRFISYENNIGVDMQDSAITYRGCFAFEGARLYGKCVDNTKESQLEITNKTGNKIRVQSTHFTLNKPLITSANARFSLKHGEYFLNNAFVALEYNTQKKEVLASHIRENKKNSKYYSSFYKVYIKGDILQWDIRSDSLTISTGQAKDAVPVIVESDEYFSNERYRKYMGLLQFHPLSLVNDYLKLKNQNTTTIEELALFYTGISDSYTKRYAILLNAMNTIFYENLIDFSIAKDELGNKIFDHTGMINYSISLTALGEHSIESFQKKKDYDKIFIPSLTSTQANVVMHFKKEYMTLNGVNSSFFTEDLKIYMKPDNETVKMYKNKNMSLNGKIFSPTMVYIGKKFDFRYDSFLIRMNQIDSVRLYESKDSLSKGSDDASIKIHIVNTTGVLHITSPKNKSGNSPKKISPKYTSQDTSYVYFDREEILNGVYDKKVYFSVPEMNIDNVNNKANNSILLKGTFYSDNIFPNIKETLKIMPDGSLGLQHVINPNGYPVYNKGDFFGKIQLDRNGIVGVGKLSYSVSLLESPKFVFYQDSVSAKGFNGLLQEKITDGRSFPKVEIAEYRMKWIPKKDMMLLYSRGNPFKFYNNTVVFDGVLILNPKALFGSGKLSTHGSITESTKYMFSQDEFSARNATFRVVSDNDQIDRVHGDNVKIQFGFSLGKVIIHPEEKNASALYFPEARIVTSIPTALWDLKTGKIFMRNNTTQSNTTSYFISTDPKTDSLTFIANRGEYDMKSFQINLDGVEKVQILDATVIPNKGKIIIRKGSVIPPLSNAIVYFITDTSTLHTFIKSNITIYSRKKSIQGNAQYKYTHKNKKVSYYNFHQFKMDSTKIKSPSKYSYKTIADGVIEEKSTDFLYFPGFLLQAKATMYADKKDLSIEGSIKPLLKNTPVKNYLSFYGYNNEIGVYSFLETAKLDESIPINIGVHYDQRLKKMYHSFLTRKNDIADMNIFSAKGFLFYDTKKKHYRVEDFAPEITTKLLDLSLEKDEEIISKEINNPYLKKEKFIYDDDDKQIFFDGTFRFIEPQKDFFNIHAAGRGNYKLDSATMNFTGFFIVDFYASSKSFSIIAEEIKEVSHSSDNTHSVIETSQDFTEHILSNVAHLLPETEIHPLIKKLEDDDYVSPISISPFFLKPIVLSKIQLKWDRQKGAWYNPLTSMGLANIWQTDININIKGFLEIIPDKQEAFVSIFLYINEEVWMHLLYTQNKVFIFSNNPHFNKAIEEEAKITKKSSKIFALQLGDWEQTNNFIETFQKKYFPKQKKLSVSFTIDKEEPQEEKN